MIKENSYETGRNETVARVCHEANRAYCKELGEFGQLEWESAPDWQKESAIKGVAFHFDNPDAGPADSHVSWLEEKKRTGWKYGPVKDAKKKEHPCYLPYEELRIEQRLKDYIFSGIVDSFRQAEEGKVYEKLLVVEDEFRKNQIIKNVLFTNCDIMPLGVLTGKHYKEIFVMLSRGSEVEKEMLDYYVNDLKTRLLPGGKITVL